MGKYQEMSLFYSILQEKSNKGCNQLAFHCLDNCFIKTYNRQNYEMFHTFRIWTWLRQGAISICLYISLKKKSALKFSIHTKMQMTLQFMLISARNNSKFQHLQITTKAFHSSLILTFFMQGIVEGILQNRNPKQSLKD